MAQIGWRIPFPLEITDPVTPGEGGSLSPAGFPSLPYSPGPVVFYGGVVGAVGTVTYEVLWFPETPGFDPPTLVQTGDDFALSHPLWLDPFEVIGWTYPGLAQIRATDDNGQILEQLIISYYNSPTSFYPQTEYQWAVYNPTVIVEIPRPNHIVPSELPLPLIEGYGMTPDSALERTPYETGPARHRRAMTFAPEVMTVTWKMHRSEVDIFKYWYRNTLKHGAERFDFEVKGQAESAWWVAIMLVPPEITLIGWDEWNVTCKLVLFGPPVAVHDTSTTFSAEIKTAVNAFGKLTVAPVYQADIQGVVTASMTLTVRGGVAADIVTSFTSSGTLTSSPSIRSNIVTLATTSATLNGPRTEQSRVWMGQAGDLGSGLVLDQKARSMNFMGIGRT